MDLRNKKYSFLLLNHRLPFSEPAEQLGSRLWTSEGDDDGPGIQKKVFRVVKTGFHKKVILGNGDIPI